MSSVFYRLMLTAVYTLDVSSEEQCTWNLFLHHRTLPKSNNGIRWLCYPKPLAVLKCWDSRLSLDMMEEATTLVNEGQIRIQNIRSRG